jgi:general secretion pathway protein F
MPRFRYTAYDASGRTVSSEIEATSANEVSRQLGSRGLVPLEVTGLSHNTQAIQPKRSQQKWWQREIGKPGKAGLRETVQFIRELSTLVGAGMTLDGALAAISDNSDQARGKQRADILRQHVMAGKPLSEAMRLEGRSFPDEVIGSVKAGESASDLAASLQRLQAQLAKRLQVQTELRSALIYPIVLILMAIGVMLVVINMLIPNIRPLFDEARVPMPTFIRLLDDAQTALISHWPIALGAIALIWMTMRSLLRSVPVRERLHRTLLGMPVMGVVIRRRETARFARVWGSQLVSGVSTLPALTVAGQAPQNLEIRSRIAQAADSIRNGSVPSSAFRDAGALVSLAYQFMAVGENSGRLGHMLLQLAEVLEADEQETVKRLMSILTPVLTLVLGLFVALLMMSLMGAINGLNDAAFK